MNAPLRDPGSDPDPDLIDDLQRLCDGRLDAGSSERLQGRLKDDPEAQQVYLDYVDTHLALGRLFRPEPARAQPLPRSVPEGRGSYRVRRPLGWLGAAAAVGVAVLTVALMSRGRPARVVARAGDETPVLVQASGARFFGRGALTRGSRLRFGEEYALTQGLMEVAFADGATAIIKAPAVFLVAERARLVMKLGRCSVYAPAGAEGFRVETPLTDIVDLGTRFSVDVADTGDTDVQVVEGVAEVQARSAPGANAGPVRLETGQARKYQLKQELVAESLPFDASRYTGRLPDRVASYTAAEREGSGGGGGSGVEELLGVTVQRGGVLQYYERAELIGIDLVHYHSGSGLHNMTTVAREPDSTTHGAGDRRRAALLDRDAFLNTGAINPGGSREPLTRDPVLNDPEDVHAPNTPGLAIRFHRPVVNSAGPDVVFFELQVIVHPERGDPFHVSPLRFAPGLKTHTVRSYDIDLASPEARTLAGFRLYRFASPARSLGDLLTGRQSSGAEYPVRTKALAVGIDLSDLGYGEGEAVDGLFFQDAQDDDNLVDPVFIAGLPPVKPAVAVGTGVAR